MSWLIHVIKEVIKLYPKQMILDNLEQAIADFIMIGIISYKQSGGNKDLLIQNLLNFFNNSSLELSHNIMTLDEKLKIYEQDIMLVEADVQPKVLMLTPTPGSSIQPKPKRKIKLTEIIQVPTPQPDELLPQCQICLENMDYTGIWPLGCGQIFHRECLQQYCLIQVQSQVFPIKCPSDTCKKDLNFIDLREALDNQSLEHYQAYSFKQLVDSRTDEYAWCPTPDCKFLFIPEGGETYFICPVCKKEYCLACRCEFHQNMNCQQYRASLKQKEQQQLDDQFLNFVKGAKFKQCPNCKFWVEKNEGCNHMTCRCKYEFCYFCGGKYNSCDCVKQINW